MVAGLERAIGDYMSGDGGHGAHGEDDFETEPRKPYEVSEDAKNLYKTIIKENFKPKVHKETIRKHEKAHKKALETLIEKTEKLEQEHHGYVNEFHVKEALAHALITYRKEAGIPVSEEEGDFHQVYQQVDALLNDLKQKGKGEIDKYMNEGRYAEIFHIIHQNEFERVKRGRLKYGIDKHLPHGKEHTFYKEVAKAHFNDTGDELSEGELAKIGRTELVDILMDHYDKKMPDTLKKYMGKKAKEYHEKHGSAHGADHGAAHH